MNKTMTRYLIARQRGFKGNLQHFKHLHPEATTYEKSRVRKPDRKRLVRALDDLAVRRRD